ncbi:LolA family protein [Portibacter lacus]|uniref:Membrane protein n=1 Tax=Portibacter lacus TaxID=1099794 RepID=A0AA37SRI8_9BACT|nr:outer membrane lipoprotein carrier protein LolA [Portibacter lacus]GLR17496.1 membrane protein [Portibacter lacus]
MKYYIASVLFVLLGFNMNSQSSVDIKDPQAKVILDKISKTLESYSSVEMDFELEISFPGMEAEIQTGKIIQQGDKYYVNMDMQSVYSDGTSLWLHMKNNNEVQWSNAESAAAGGFMDPSSLLNMYKTGEYAYAITGEASGVQSIEFKPLDSSSPYSKMRLEVVKGKNEVKQMTVFAKDASKYTMKIKEIISNKTYPDETFVFNKSKYPGVHVEDLRID